MIEARVGIEAARLLYSIRLEVRAPNMGLRPFEGNLGALKGTHRDMSGKE